MAVKPSTVLHWMTGYTGVNSQQPTSGVQAAGFSPGQQPAYNLVNYQFQNLCDWRDYFESLTDTIKGVIGIYQAYVGSGILATHADLNAVMADSGIAAGSRVLVLSNATLNTIQQITKNNIFIEFQPGVTYSKGTANYGIQIAASISGCRIRGGSFSGFSTGGNAAIRIESTALPAWVTECLFAGNAIDIDDQSGAAVTGLNYTDNAGA